MSEHDIQQLEERMRAVEIQQARQADALNHLAKAIDSVTTKMESLSSRWQYIVGFCGAILVGLNLLQTFHSLMRG